jgi:hypothetical protein
MSPTRPLLLCAATAAFLWLCGCAGQITEGGVSLLSKSIGVERVMELRHPSCAGHFGVDAVRMPRRDPVHGEMRDSWLLVMSGGTGIYAALVDDDWTLVDDRYWPAPGLSVPWSDVKVVRLRDAAGRERVMIYFVSRGTNQIQITDATAFPDVVTTTVPIDIGLPILIRGAHKVQVHEQRGVIVLNGIDPVAQDPMPAPLTYGCAPAAFYDVRTDPMRPRLLSLFTGEGPGEQVMFDTQFLRIAGRDVWATPIFQPLAGGASWFAFYDFADAAAMARPTRLALYGTPASGTAHNLVQLPPAADGSPRLAASYEAWAFGAAPHETVSKVAVLDATDLDSGRNPTFVSWMRDASNHRHASHTPCSRLYETRSHTRDTVPIAHFTGGYYCFRFGDDQDDVELLAHVPISDTVPSAAPGRYHTRMDVQTWLACYNGAWDAVATHIGDLVSSTDREASYLIEPTWGFTRQFGTHLAAPDGTVPRVLVTGGVPHAGGELRVRVTGLAVGGRLTLVLASKAAERPQLLPRIGAVFHDPDAVFATLEADVLGESIEFTIPSLPAVDEVVMTAWETDAGRPGGVLKTPAARCRVRPAPQ